MAKDLQNVEEGLFALKSLFELSKTLSSTVDLQTILNNILLTPMGRMKINKGVVLLQCSDTPGEFVVEALKGIPRDNLKKRMSIDNPPDRPFLNDEHRSNGSTWAEFLKENKLFNGFPIVSRDKTHGMLIFGGKMSGDSLSESEIDFLNSLSNLSATAIEKSLMIQELKSVNKKLDHSNQELNTIFEIANELSATFNVDKIVKLLGYSLMGQMLVSKYALFILQDDKFILKGSQGYFDLQGCLDKNPDISAFLRSLKTPYLVEKGVKQQPSAKLNENDIRLVIPMQIQEKLKGIVCLGEKSKGAGYSEDDMGLLTTLGNQAMISLENARLVEEMLEKQRIEEELALAREIQKNLLPDEFPATDGVQFEAVNISSQSVGGDYYDILQFEDRTQGIVIADVSGKGIPASLLMANVQASFHALAEVIVNPAKLISKVNNLTYKNTASDKFITLFYCRFHPEKRSLEYCNAGHNHPFVLSGDGRVRFLDTGGLILGMLPDLEYQYDSVSLKQGDVLVMYTDGISEALNAKNEEFGEENLMEVCKNNRHLSAAQIKDAILSAVDDFSSGVPQYDDMTLVILKIE